MVRGVAVTGMGVVAPVGNDVESAWRAMCDGKSGIDAVSRFDASQFPTRIAGEVKGFAPQEHFSTKELRRTSRFLQFCIVASKQAVDQAGLDPSEIDCGRAGVIVGSGIGGLPVLEKEHRVLIERGPSRVSPFLMPNMLANMAPARIAILYGFTGPNASVVTACATAANAVGDAARAIRCGDADLMIAGGSETPITPLGFAGFCAVKAMSTRNDEPQKASRPFDADRDGFVMSEGAAIVVLEEMEHARARGACILAELAGYGRTSDAFSVVAPQPGGDGPARAMLLALDDANLRPDDVDYVNAHGTSTVQNDRAETAAIKKAFGDSVRDVSISSTKSVTGHLLGAAGSLELVACVKAIEENVVPPTINLDNPAPDCDLDYTPNRALKRDVDVALSNSLGFGGHNAVLVVRRVE